MPTLVRVDALLSWLAATHPLLLVRDTSSWVREARGACLTLSLRDGPQNYPTAPHPHLTIIEKVGHTCDGVGYTLYGAVVFADGGATEAPFWDAS